MDLHPACEPVAFLLGTWAGSGVGGYPTIERFAYNEEVTFGHVGKPFLSYTQRTRHAESGQPLHAESGYLRAIGGDQLEFVVVQPSGIVELHHGQVQGQQIVLSQLSVHTTPSAKSVSAVQRHVWLDSESGALTYDVSMAAVGQPLTHHLHAELLPKSPS